MRVLALFLSINMLLGVTGYYAPYLMEENNLLENIQVLVLLLSMATFLYASYKGRLTSIAVLCAVICLAFILREIDIEKLQLPQLVLVIFSGTGKYILMLLLIIPTSIWILKNYRIDLLIERFLVPFRQLAVFSIIFFALSWIFDKDVINTNYNMVFEELAELNAYILIFISSVLYNQKTVAQNIHNDY